MYTRGFRQGVARGGLLGIALPDGTRTPSLLPVQVSPDPSAKGGEGRAACALVRRGGHAGAAVGQVNHPRESANGSVHPVHCQCRREKENVEVGSSRPDLRIGFDALLDFVSFVVA